jgi:integrase/recombinase XerD
MLVKQFHYLSKNETELVLKNLKSKHHIVIILLMLDCGLRVTEACSIKFKNFDFKNRTLTIQSLKKKRKDLRTIPISNRLYQSLGEYLHHLKIELNSDSYLFPTKNGLSHISRKTIWATLSNLKKKISIENLHPHSFRHSFATHHLSHGTSLAEIKEMLGHKSYNTTLIYAEIPTEKLKERVNAVTSKPLTLFEKFSNMIIPPKKSKLINLDFTESYFTIGRNTELRVINSNSEIGVNTLLIGPIGTGKTHILNNLETTKKVLKLDDTEAIKKSLVQILLYLHKDKKLINSILWKDFSVEEITKKIQRENIIHLADTIIASVKPKEYVLLIDDISVITNTAKKVVERLKDTFVIIAGAREVKANNTSFIWNFERVDLKPLNRKFAMQLIQQLSGGLEVENLEIFRNHIYDQTNGNPRAITELIERYKKEPFLDIQTIREIKHTGALQEIDMTFMVVMFLGLMTVLRYMARDFDEPALRFIGSIAMVGLLMFRPLMNTLKRKFI